MKDPGQLWRAADRDPDPDPDPGPGAEVTGGRRGLRTTRLDAAGASGSV